jgi:hypothetical protein
VSCLVPTVAVASLTAVCAGVSLSVIGFGRAVDGPPDATDSAIWLLNTGYTAIGVGFAGLVASVLIHRVRSA